MAQVGKDFLKSANHVEKKGRERGGRKRKSEEESQKHCKKLRENQWEWKDRWVTGGLHFTLNFRKLSKSSNALWKGGCFISVHCFSNLASTNVMINSIIWRGNVIRPSSSAGTTGPTRGRQPGSGAPRPAVPSRGCKEEVNWGRDCEAEKNKALKPREICHVIITVGHNLHLLLKQPISFQNQQKRQLEGLFLFQQGPEETADWTLQLGDRHSGMKIISQENLRENMGQIQTLHESIPQPSCSTTKAILHNNSRLPWEITTLGGKKTIALLGLTRMWSPLGSNASHSTQGRLRTSTPLILNKYLLSARLLHTEVNYRL